ncbi:ATP-binding protein [Tsukamurella sp. NPDC003166]|uniref:ATP-binding protein n=1 Tax=Tsukamurella sp. NPDC003166 TaxID=3154444 RepID=UPI0033A82C6C
MVGRSEPRSELRRVLDTVASTGTSAPQVCVVRGLDGIGKTSVLRAVQFEAETRFAMCTLRASLRSGTPSDALAAAARRRCGEAAVVPVRGRRAHRPASCQAHDIEALLRSVARRTVEERPGGLAVFLDDADGADPAVLRTVARVVRSSREGRAGAPVAFFIAAAPGRLSVDSVSADEARFETHDLERLDADASRRFLALPAASGGVEWEEEAIDRAAAWAAGFPAALQVIGAHAWAAALTARRPARTMSKAHVDAATRPAIRSLGPLYVAALKQVTEPRERRFLDALATLPGGTATQADVARAMGVPGRTLTAARARLTQAGVLVAAESGGLAFGMPGLDAHLRFASRAAERR